VLPRILFLLLAATSFAQAENSFVPDISANVTRPWPGKDFWANPAEDWVVSQGRFENTFSGGNRNIVLLTAELTAEAKPFTARVHLDQISFELFGTGFAGFQVGLQGESGDFREAAVAGAGLPAGIDFQGRPFIGTMKGEGTPIPLPLHGIVLELQGEAAAGGNYELSLLVQDETGKILTSTKAIAHPSWLTGLVALTSSTQPPPAIDPKSPRPARTPAIAQTRDGEGRFAFSKLGISGGKVALHPEHAFGPILWTTYTIDNDGTLCLLAQAAPFSRTEKFDAVLTVPGRDPQKATIDPVSRTVRFRILRLDPTKEYPYEVTMAGDSFKGSIRPAPAGRPLKVASLSCNDASGFPDADLVANVRAQAPDFITFLGDQIYEGSGGYGLVYDHRPNDRAVISYLRKYAMHGWTWRDILRNIPSITLPDDHDVFQSNMWGAAGKAADVTQGYGPPAQDSGGYKMSTEFVNAVHRTQTGNLPDPADPAPCRSGVTVYFTRHAWGPLDFVILADRQFKSAPAAALSEAKIKNGWPTNPAFDPKTQAGAAELDLLGIRQENFLSRWAKSPAKGAKFRIALSQTPFCSTQTLPADVSDDNNAADMKIHAAGEYPPDDQPKPDFASNAWPQEPRMKALHLLKEARAIHLTGDQHLGSTGQYGLDAWNDGPWWITSPAISNAWPRRWMPAAEGKNRRAGAPKWTGEFEDAFGSRLTLHAVANPRHGDREPTRVFDHAVGYTMTVWDPASGHVRVEDWPYWASPAKLAPDNKPYDGWPITIDPASGKRVD
jgi:phosphodiesterase/alkaline phosphatase D-like protein